MKFKLDENLDVRLVHLMAEQGFEADSVLGESIAGVSDEGLFDACKRTGRILVTLDLDFANPLRFPPQSSPGLPAAQVLTSLPRPHPRLSFATHSEYCHDGQSWTWDGVRFEMLHPAETSTGKTPEHDNERSCVLRISIGQQSMLLAADIEHLSEQRLLAVHQGELPATLLVAPHHGSKSSSSQAFVDAVHPRHVVFTAAYRNRFGHPREEVVARYRAVAPRCRAQTRTERSPSSWTV